jgi:predicted nuclease with TOPRIM domain
VTTSKNDDPGGCPDRAIGECEAVCAVCQRDMHPELERLRDELGMEMGMRSVAVDELESLRRELWQPLGEDQLSDEDTLDRLRARVAELERLRGWYEQVRAENGRLHQARDVRNDEMLALRARIAELERRDEAVAAVEQWWAANRHREAAVEHAARVVLDELVRVRREGEQ